MTSDNDKKNDRDWIKTVESEEGRQVRANDIYPKLLHLLEDLPKAAQEISRVLKPGGQFLIVTAHPDAHATWKARYAETKLEGKRLEGKLKNLDQSESSEVLYLHELGEILSAFQAAGLNIQRSESFRLFFLFQGSKK